MILADPVSDSELVEQGFTVIPLLDRLDAAELRASWAARARTDRPGFDAGFVGLDSVAKRAAHDLVVGALGGPARVAVPGHRPLVGSFAVKQPGPGSAMPIHQDWCVVDEDRWSSVSVWCALDDVSPERGPLAFWPGSHRLRVLRGSGLPDPCGPVAHMEDGFVPLSLQAGEAVVYFHATIHRSAPNAGATTRVGAMLGLIPDGAEPIHFHRADDGTVEVCRAGTEFYLAYPFGEAPLPPTADLLERRPFDGRVIRPEELRALSR
jgi:hypothetical protein